MYTRCISKVSANVSRARGGQVASLLIVGGRLLTVTRKRLSLPPSLYGVCWFGQVCRPTSHHDNSQLDLQSRTSFLLYLLAYIKGHMPTRVVFYYRTQWKNSKR